MENYLVFLLHVQARLHKTYKCGGKVARNQQLWHIVELVFSIRFISRRMMAEIRTFDD
jgi:hypothetical protein